MPSAQSPAEKVCVICRNDCSGRPRIKDQKGHYYCRECYDGQSRKRPTVTPVTLPRQPLAPLPSRAAPIRPPKPEPVKDDNLDLLELADGDVASHDRMGITFPPCPSCGDPFAPSAVICINCGYNRETGGRIVIQDEKPEPESRSLADWLPSFSFSGMSFPPILAFIGPMVVLVPFYLAAKNNAETAAAYILCASVFNLAVGICVLVSAAKDGKFLLCLCVPFYAAAYVFGMSESPLLKWATTASIIAGVSIRVLEYQ